MTNQTVIEQTEIESDTDEGTYVEVYAIARRGAEVIDAILLRTDFYPR